MRQSIGLQNRKMMVNGEPCAPRGARTVLEGVSTAGLPHDLDIQVSRLRLLKANHVSQQYRLETDVARTYPAQIASTREYAANLAADIQTAEPLFREDASFQMKVLGASYGEKKEAGEALIQAATATKMLNQTLTVGEFGGFRLEAEYNPFANVFELAIHGQGRYHIELGRDPLGNITRIHNALSALPGKREEAQRKLETLNEQLEDARKELGQPFPQEAELAEKQERLAALDALLNIDDRSSEAAMLDDPGADADEPEVNQKKHCQER